MIFSRVPFSLAPFSTKLADKILDSELIWNDKCKGNSEWINQVAGTSIWANSSLPTNNWSTITKHKTSNVRCKNAT